ncbi:hypothetical protein M099_3488 [Phocaeicola vulgatus str. 3975 RP4]|uniref:Uncharacterized protein n=1 Tax=Phocaeicola vulgatus str. 3975 RP4 TaxID=1339352 RepID=A0A069S8U8_PHOVU|nr:hypothetical protein M099_3488 [Phocaeicola vulgatus str. 3975 RP4]
MELTKINGSYLLTSSAFFHIPILLFILLRKGKILPYSCTNGHSL